MIQGPSDNAIIAGSEADLFCQVYTTESSGIQQQPTQPYNVTWYFKPEGVNNSKVMLNLNVTDVIKGKAVCCINITIIEMLI